MAREIYLSIANIAINLKFMNTKTMDMEGHLVYQFSQQIYNKR